MSEAEYDAEEMADYTEDQDLDPSVPTPHPSTSQRSPSDPAAAGHDDEEEEDPEIVEMKRKLAELEEENTKIAALSSSSPSSSTFSPSGSASSPLSTGSSAESDARSVYVGSVDYSSTRDELTSLFSSCGPVLRVTLPTTAQGHPKGFAYVEFADRDSVNTATLLNDTEFKGRQLKVIPKRTNLPAFQLGGRGGGRGRGGRGRGRGGGRGGMRRLEEGDTRRSGGGEGTGGSRRGTLPTDLRHRCIQRAVWYEGRAGYAAGRRGGESHFSG